MADTAPAIDVAADTGAGSEVEEDADIALDPDTDGADTASDVLVDVASDSHSGPACSRGDLEFIDLPEASGAVPLGASFDLFVADSGHSGRALIVPRGATAAAPIPLTMPLGVGAGDDLEGLANGPDGLVYGLTSSGYLRAWRVESNDGTWGATLVSGPTPIADQGEWVGGPNEVNGAGNFEGLCLHPAPKPGACAGWAASKARGELVCIRAEPTGYRLDPEVRHPVFLPEYLSDCAYEDAPPYRLFAAGNVYSEDRLVEVRPEGVLDVPLLTFGSDQVGAPNQEAILVRSLSEGLEIQSMGDWQDLGGDRSPRVRFFCSKGVTAAQ